MKRKLFALLVVIVSLLPDIASAAKAVSTAYRLDFDPSYRNRSWTMVTLLLIGDVIPGPALFVTVAQKNGAASAFATAVPWRRARAYSATRC